MLIIIIMTVLHNNVFVYIPIDSKYITGTLPGVFIMESMIEHVAVAVGKSAEDVKRANLYKQGQVRHACA